MQLDMDKIQIISCILCESIKEEPNKLFSFIKVYGVFPNVIIVVDKIDEPINEITFVTFFKSPPGEIVIVPQILNPEGNILIGDRDPSFKLNPVEMTHQGIFSLTIEGFLPSREGEYRYILNVDQVEIFNSTFTIRVSPSKESA